MGPLSQQQARSLCTCRPSGWVLVSGVTWEPCGPPSRRYYQSTCGPWAGLLRKGSHPRSQDPLSPPRLPCVAVGPPVARASSGISPRVSSGTWRGGAALNWHCALLTASRRPSGQTQADHRRAELGGKIKATSKPSQRRSLSRAAACPACEDSAQPSASCPGCAHPLLYFVRRAASRAEKTGAPTGTQGLSQRPCLLAT